MPVRLYFSSQDGYADPTGGAIESMAVFSLFTTRGLWWADVDCGSKIETILSQGITDESLQAAATYAKECFAWMIQDGLARKVETACTVGERGIPLLDVTFYRPGKVPDVFKTVWEIQL